MILGGSPKEAYRDVEYLEFDDDGNHPPLYKPGDLPRNMSGLVAAFVDGHVVACGGYETAECFFLNSQFGQWYDTAPMDRQRYGAVGFVVNDDLWFVLGGKDRRAEGKPVLNTSVVYNAGNFFRGDDLPYPAFFPCATKLNETHVFFAGGNDGVATRRDAYILDSGSWTWTRLPDMRRERYRVSCGKAGNKIYVVGGDPNQDSSEVLDLDTLEWSEGPGVPTASGKFWASPQPYQMADTFRLVGGYDGDTWLDTVFELDPEKEVWIERPERLEQIRDSNGVVHVPEESLGGLKYE